MVRNGAVAGYATFGLLNASIATSADASLRCMGGGSGIMIHAASARMR